MLLHTKLFILCVGGLTIDGGHSLPNKRNLPATDGHSPPSNVWMEPGEDAIKVGWTLPSDADDIMVCAVEYRAEGSDRSVNVPVEKTERSLVLSDLERNTLYEIRLYCLYENIPGPPTEWFGVSTRTVSVNPSVCSGSLLHASLEPICLRYPSHGMCRYRCHDGYRMSDVADVMFGDRESEGIMRKEVFCIEGTWITYSTNNGRGFIDICLPEAEFQKCPLSIPNGSLEPHCGPATDWLCHFECNDGYAKHAYMKGTLKWFADREYSLLCEEGMWKTGYEYVGLDVSGVCVPSERNCTDSVPNLNVHTPCPSGYYCSFECNDGYRKQAWAGSSLFCENGVWVVPATKYDPSITPQTACLPIDPVSVCPRNITNGHVGGDCNVQCRPGCVDGYKMPRWSEGLTCEEGNWMTDDYAYDDTNICFPEGKVQGRSNTVGGWVVRRCHVSFVTRGVQLILAYSWARPAILVADGHPCPQEIPNGLMDDIVGRRSDYENQRAYELPTCNDGFRKHRTLSLECIGGTWRTGQERFGLDASSACVQETDENTWFSPFNP